ncbi:MAG: hypothetical protein A2017_00510 [Lentisphaerae bacterium GWF2_44_16]|nr:MAG: hypothetical protein A2017_00510 [Lentisphaerae bacterium GWF2_44_16]
MLNEQKMENKANLNIDLMKIIDDEKWYEGERRHSETYPDDMEVKRNVYCILSNYHADVNLKRLFDKYTL